MMLELNPSNEAVQCRADKLEMGMARIVALVRAVSELALVLPAAVQETEPLQSLVGILEETAPVALGDIRWLMEAFANRSQQVDSLLKSAA